LAPGGPKNPGEGGTPQVGHIKGSPLGGRPPRVTYKGRGEKPGTMDTRARTEGVVKGNTRGVPPVGGV